MEIKMVPVIEAFFKAKNDYDSTEFIACFTDDAVVQDEGREICGKTAIKNWIEASIEKYRVTVAAKRIIERDNETVLTAQVSGNFEGSPVLFDYHFVIGENKISRLRIKLTE
ncbi:nuclear transport factor 2 family protein [Dendrosporobacter sp. 1207_IL3150]|uniref:nuclear transport factor 2 family protein n=1 Tax=Dendrosporobacter sp. 1207_IL3150 TaxID=3084054 RepID=UPI002FDAD67E